MANKLAFVITIPGQLYVSSRKFGNFLETNDFIPATTLRGALASAICVKPGKWQCDSCDIRGNCNFDKIFTNDKKVYFDNLYPLANIYYKDAVLALPASAVSCKKQPGFLSQHKFELFKGYKKPYDNTPHGVFDTLIPQIARKIAGDCGIDIKCNYNDCKMKVEPYDGFYNIAPRDDSYLRSQKEYTYILVKSEIPQRRLVRTAINRVTRTAEESLLYSLAIIEEQKTFFVSITVEDDTFVQTIQDELEKLSDVRLGGVRSRGLGEMEISNLRQLDFDAGLRERIDTFNHFLKEYVNNNFNSYSEDKCYFTLNLHSDTIVKNKKGEYSSFISPEILIEHLKCINPNLDLSGLELFKWNTSQSHFSGWSDAWKLPKEIEPSIKRGSLFVFKIDQLTDELVKALEQIQIWGMGERCEEGYGRVIICDPFHWGFHEKVQPYKENWRF